MCCSRLKSWGIALLLGAVTSPFWAAEPLKVVAISSDFASIARSIGGERVRVSTLITGSRNLHHINPKPSMIVTLRDADLLIRLGMGQDTWIDGLIQVARNPHLFPGKQGYLDPSGPIEKLEVPTEHIDGRHGDVHLEGNPHYWLNPMNGLIIAAQIRDRLVVLDPEGEDLYQENYQVFQDTLLDSMIRWQEVLDPIKGYYFVTYHTVWSYFFDAFSLQSFGQLEPVPGVPPTPKHLHALQETVLGSQGPVLVLCASYYPSKACASFAKEAGLAFLSTPPNASAKEGGYLAFFDQLTEDLVP